MESPRRFGSRARGALLALALSAGLVLAAEGALRLAGWPRRGAELELVGAIAPRTVGGRLVVDPRRLFAVAADYRSSPEHAGRFATGSWPHRGRPAEPAPAGIARVVVVGDSCVYGVGVTVSESLPERLQAELAELGWDASHVQVLNLGTAGYSTVQVDLVVAAALADLEPDVVVLYPAAWNDQAPALGPNDLALVERTRGPAGFVRGTALFAFLRDLAGGPGRPEGALSPEEVHARWERGAAPFGTRVPAERVEPVLRHTLERCAHAGVPAVLIVPAHPPATERRWPRVLADAESVRRAGRAAGVPWIDGARVLAAAAGGESERERLFLDFVHPTAEGHTLLAAAAAPAVAAALGERPASRPGPVAVRAVSPASFSALGDVRVRVELGGWSRGEPLPAVTVGGAPLLDLSPAADSAVEGVAMANGPGPQDVVVQTADGCAVVKGAVVLELPRLERANEDPLVIRLRARPGDRAVLVAGRERRERPLRDRSGASWIAAEGAWSGLVAFGAPDADGVMELRLAELPPDADPLVLQALVTPAGVEAGESGYWSEPLDLGR